MNALLSWLQAHQKVVVVVCIITVFGPMLLVGVLVWVLRAVQWFKDQKKRAETLPLLTGRVCPHCQLVCIGRSALDRHLESGLCGGLS